MAIRCSKCGSDNFDDATHCYSCGHRFSILSRVPKINIGEKTFVYAVAIFIPFVGILSGFMYLSQPGPENKHVGKVCLMMALPMHFLLVILLYVFTIGL